jgi:hypothetical protein
MPIDPRIPLGYEPAPYIDPRQLRAQRIAEEQQERQAQVQQMQLREQERQITEQQSFRDALGRGAKLDELARISPAGAASYQKLIADQRKAQLDQEREQLQVQGQKLSMLGQLAGTMQDQPTFERGIQQAAQMGLISPEEAQTYLQHGWNAETASRVQQVGQQALTMAQQIDLQFKQAAENRAQAADTRAQAGEQRAQRQFDVETPGRVADAAIKQMNAAGQAVGAVRGQAQYDAWRASLPADLQGRLPVMYSPSAIAIVQRMGMTPQQRAQADAGAAAAAESARHNSASEMLTLRGQNKVDSRTREMMTMRQENRPPSSVEQRVYGFYSRAKDAADTLNEMQAKMLGKGMFSQAWQKFAPNFAQSEDNQMYQQAQRQFTEARLRKDSGAVVPQSEYENDRVTYFPQPGDGKRVIERKAAARKALLDSLLRESGRAGVVGNGAPVADVFGSLGFELEDK